MLGRGAAPLFFYLIGYDNRLHINARLITYGLILSFLGVLIWDRFWINILINFIVVYTCLIYFPIEKLALWVKITGFIALSILNGPCMYFLEYGTMGILWAYCGRLYASTPSSAFYLFIPTTVVYYFWENVVFRFYDQLPILYAFSILLVLMLWLMGTYRLQTLSVTPLLRLPGLLLSRYSLDIYFYHLAFLQVYYLYLRYTPH
jgi:hypothetical protein